MQRHLHDQGKLGLKWRGTILISTGFAVPILYIAIAGGPEGQKELVAEDDLQVVPVSMGKPMVEKPAPVPEPDPSGSGSAGSANENPAGSAVLIPLPPDDN